MTRQKDRPVNRFQGNPGGKCGGRKKWLFFQNCRIIYRNLLSICPKNWYLFARLKTPNSWSLDEGIYDAMTRRLSKQNALFAFDSGKAKSRLRVVDTDQSNDWIDQDNAVEDGLRRVGFLAVKSFRE